MGRQREAKSRAVHHGAEQEGLRTQRLQAGFSTATAELLGKRKAEKQEGILQGFQINCKAELPKLLQTSKPFRYCLINDRARRPAVFFCLFLNANPSLPKLRDFASGEFGLRPTSLVTCPWPLLLSPCHVPPLSLLSLVHF